MKNLEFVNSYAKLPEAFYSPQAISPLQGLRTVSLNAGAVQLLDLDPQQLDEQLLQQVVNGQTPLTGIQPLAALYAGHQFGQYVPQLGDGRAILLGEVQNRAGERWELQLKGAGPTPYSRQGDGRAVLRSTIREYLCSEAMHGLGIPTTRALAMFDSETPVYRESVERGALLVRMAPSHVRFGSFEVFFYRDQHEHIQTLADYVIEHHYPELRAQPQPYVALLNEVVARTAKLIAQWQAVGFAHGVMNTDNMSILGLTIDYGPFGFLDAYQPGFICNHSDYHGRYAFDKQPSVGLWNCSCLAQALLPLMEVEEAKQALSTYENMFAGHYTELLLAKLGLQQRTQQNAEVIDALLKLLQANHPDYTRFFRGLCDFDSSENANNDKLRDMFIDREAFDQWAGQYRAALQQENSDDAARRARMQSVNPKYILRNYLAQTTIEKAEQGDYSEVNHLLKILQAPFDEHPGSEAYAAEPPDWASRIEVSCSS